MPQYKVGDAVKVVRIVKDEDGLKIKHDPWNDYIGRVGIVRDLVRTTSLRTRKSTWMYDIKFGPGDDWIYAFCDEIEKYTK